MADPVALETPRPAPLRQRARAPTGAELAMVPWLGAARRRRSASGRWPTCRSSRPHPGDYVCKIGRQATYWFGVLDGLLKMSNDSSLGFAITFTGVPPGAWFGEGTLLKREVYRYNIEPLRKSVVAGLGIETFHWLLERSIPFNRYVMNQLNERLGQFIAAREIDRLDDPDTRVARNLGGAVPPGAVPGRGHAAAHHAAGAGLPRRAVEAARQRGAEFLAGRRPRSASSTAACACSSSTACAAGDAPERRRFACGCAPPARLGHCRPIAREGMP